MRGGSSPLIRTRLHRGNGRLAQLVERRIYTANVGGSSPSSSTLLNFLTSSVITS
jgi:hypothetical protein